MKILILSHEYPPYVFGGVAYYTMELAKYLSSRGYTVYVVAGRSKGLHEFRDRVRVMRVGFPDIPIRSFWYSIASRDLVFKLLKDVDYVVFNAGSAGFLPIWLSDIKRGVKLISVFHGTVYSLMSYFNYVGVSDKLRYINLLDTLYYSSFLSINVWLNRQELEASDDLVTVARHIVEELVRIYPEFSRYIYSRFHVVYGGIDYDYLSSIYETSRRESIGNVYEKKIVYAYVGRLYLAKGVHHALKVFKYIQEELGKETELWIFGAGPLGRSVMKYVKKNNLNARLFGFIPREKLLKLLAKHVSVLLFPSLYEGCPYTLLESNSLGIPVVSWDMPWTREFVFEGANGYRAKPFSLEELAKLAIKALSIPSKKTRETAQKYNKNSTLPKFESLLVKNLR